MANDAARKKAMERKAKHPQPALIPAGPTLTIINPNGSTTAVQVWPRWPSFER